MMFMADEVGGGSRGGECKRGLRADDAVIRRQTRAAALARTAMSDADADSRSLPAVGAHCALPSCNLNDFLPIRCRCQQLFCREHVAPDVHDCPLQRATPTSSDAPALKLQRCAAQGCNKPSLESFIANPTDTTNRSPAVCQACTQAFCAQ